MSHMAEIKTFIHNRYSKAGKKQWSEWDIKLSETKQELTLKSHSPNTGEVIDAYYLSKCKQARRQCWFKLLYSVAVQH